MNRLERKNVAYLCFIVLCTVFLSSGSLSAKSKEQMDLLQPVQATVNGINVSIDPRIELLSVVQILSTYNQNFGLMTDLDFTYRQDVLDQFSTFASHPAVTLFSKMSMKGFSYDAPPTMMLYLTNAFELDENKELDEKLVLRAGSMEQLKSFASMLKQFAADTNFQKFYLEHESFYKKMIKQVSQVLEKESYITELEEYYNIHNNSYNIILAPLHRGGGFGPRLTDAEGKNDIYSILGPIDVVEDIPVFGDKQSFDYLVWHEFSHSFINPLTEVFQNQFTQSDALFAPIAVKMERLAYSNWETALNEHLIRTITARRTLYESGQEAYEKAIKDEKRQGFFYIELLSDKIASYEQNRKEYKDFNAFYPEIVKLLNELNLHELDSSFYTMPFEGPINAALQIDGQTVVIMPSQENTLVQEKITEYCMAIVNLLTHKLGMQATAIIDKEALQMDLSDKNIIAYGTVEGNLWLKAYETKLPFKITKDKIVADEIYSGNNLRLISALPHPNNEAKSLLIYTAQEAIDILNINSVNHGMTDYVVAKNEEIIAQDNYLKAEKTWKYK